MTTASGAVTLLEPAERKRIIAMVCSDPPAGRARWTVRLVAEEAVKRRLVPKVGRKTSGCCCSTTISSRGGKKMWNVPELTEQYVERMEDVLETYERPLDPAEPVVCLDEKPITLHAEVRPFVPAEPGREARRDSEYKRCGTANVFCAVEPLAGRHFTFATPNRSGLEFAMVVAKLALAYPEASTIHLVMDNLNIHRRKSLTDTFGKEIGTEIWDRALLTPVSGQSTYSRP